MTFLPPSTGRHFPRRVLISGASGLVGRHLVPRLQAQGHEITRLVRRPPVRSDEIFWDPERGELAASALAEIEGVVHLAGENIAAGRWTPARRRAIRESRVRGTQLLATRWREGARRPRVWVSASGTGYYGERGDEVLTEAASSGGGFLAEVCRAWEQASAELSAAGVRVVHLRTGMALTAAGGALAKMLPAFRAGLGGRLGSGRQWWSWIGLDDLLAVYRQALVDPRCIGPINAVAPAPVTQREFATTLAHLLHRPAALWVPAWGLRLLWGTMANETILASTRVEPAKLRAMEFAFRSPTLTAALTAALTPPGAFS